MKNKNEVKNDQGDSVVDKSKRSFSKASMATPILMSFASRPSWAMENCSFNQALSGNLSTPGTECGPGLPSARSPGIFQGLSVDEWQIRYSVGDAVFKLVFPQAPAVSVVQKKGNEVISTNTSPTFKQILDASANQLTFDADTDDAVFEPYEVNAMNARSLHYIAAYLCSLSPVFVFPFTVNEVTADWGVWDLFSSLQLILINDEMTVQEVADTLGITV